MIDTASETWRSVVEYCEQRIEELTDLCIDPAAQDVVRQACATRIDELRALLGEPTEAQARARRVQIAQHDAGLLPAD